MERKCKDSKNLPFCQIFFILLLGGDEKKEYNKKDFSPLYRMI
jgi:hypothetical protein